MQTDQHRAVFGHTATNGIFTCVLFWIGIAPVLAQAPEWSERDLAKSVHRAEQTFNAGEMSRAYGLFAHLVSVANDRAFLHYRFGATCTYTSQRLNEAKEHLEIARELGVLESEHEAGWHYYKGRLHHIQYEFSEAAVHFRTAIDLAGKNDHWLNDAKLRFGQCTNQIGFTKDAFVLEEKETLISHSEDFFRLYEFPISMGRLLVVPQQLLSKEDKKREFESQLHWLPGHRYAYYASYGKEGDTGLDIYRVAVNGSGEYGEPLKMPSPINGDFDDCSPICIPGNTNEIDRIFFSSSRPESIGGFDIFESQGDFTSDLVTTTHEEMAIQLPFEINSTADEHLYWDAKGIEQAWLTTNRNQDFEGREVWRFNRNWERAWPIALTFTLDKGALPGTLVISSSDGQTPVLQSILQSGESFSTILKQQSKLTIAWEGESGELSWSEVVEIPSHNQSVIASDPIIVSSPTKGTISAQLASIALVNQPELSWTYAAMNAKVCSGEFGEPLSDNEFANLYGNRLEEISIEKVLQAANQSSDDATVEQNTIPQWMLNAMLEAEILQDFNLIPQTITQARKEALAIQGQMEKTQCWDAPGSEMWKVKAAIERYGEPALAVLSDQTRSLRNQTAKHRDDWAQWTQKLEDYVQPVGSQSEDWMIMLAYFEAQVKSYNGAVVHAEDMYRRIDSHLQFERWLSETMPLEIPEFRDDLIRVLNSAPEVYQAMNQAATALGQQADPSRFLHPMQSGLWNAFTDSISELQTMDIYSLPGMEDSQAWFLRSGGIMEEIESIPDINERKSKGQQAIGLAWETYQAGAEQYERVIAESQMSPGAWWQSFGPRESNADESMQSNDYDGYEMFVKHDDPILEQAHLYQKELDNIRTGTKNQEAHRAHVKRAIAMRSTIANEMIALFGGESTRRDNRVKVATKKVSESNVPEEINHRTPVSESNPLATISSVETTVLAAEEEEENPAAETLPIALSTKQTTERIYTVQVGAFINQPDFKQEQTTDEAFVIEVSGKLTKYGIGRHADLTLALDHLDQIKKWSPDAFVRQIPNTVETTKKVSKNGNASDDSNPPAKENVKKAEPAARKKSSAKTPAKRDKTASSNVESTKNFRVRIVEYSGTLQPAEVASLLRLGNAVRLKTAKLTGKTVYFTENFTSIEGAQDALAVVLSQGFKQAEIEVTY